MASGYGLSQVQGCCRGMAVAFQGSKQQDPGRLRRGLRVVAGVATMPSNVIKREAAGAAKT